ncbi:MAG: ECF transporter S component [Anaerostipes sp.]|jgi:uncharacterized membrane protein|nr:ECF transporter S component [Anaerostipes sp.]MDD3747648.1 ECF transporter S component [Anaerostipes sp.]
MDNKKVLRMVQISLFITIILIMTFTPLGYLRLGLLEISLLTIPVGIGAMLFSPTAGAVLGFVFGITSFARFFGLNPFGAVLVGINPFYAFLVAVPTRTLMGFLTGVIFKLLQKSKGMSTISYYIGGFLAPFLNTVFFMGVLVLCYWNTDYIQNLNTTMGSLNPITFICAFVGINAVVEIVAGALVGGTVSKVLHSVVRSL